MREFELERMELVVLYLLVVVMVVVVMEVDAVGGTQGCWYLVVLRVVLGTGPVTMPALIWHC